MTLSFGYSLLAVALGGALGSVLRYVTSYGAQQLFGSQMLWATLGVNLLGSLLIGMMAAMIGGKLLVHELWRPFIVIGFLGGLTTFSAFSLELLMLIQKGDSLLGAVYAVCSVIGCLFMTYLGFALVSATFPSS